jgi:outer membrane protein OmpA-like peptidoglycan-associated protein
MTERTIKMGVALTFLSLSGCAAAQPSQQLVDAREVMSKASDGHAKEHAPSDLDDARKLLDRAEHQKDGSAEEIQYAYLADRAAKRADAHGSALYFVAQTEETDTRFNELQEKRRIEAERNLDEMQREMSDVEEKMLQKDANLAALGVRKSELEAAQQRIAAELSVSTSALAISEKARLEAEARAAAAVASLSALGNVREEANRTVLTLSGSVLFETGKSVLLPLAEDSLVRVAEALKELPPGRRVVIEGHTDSRGDDESNKKLSQARAQSVMQFLQSQGVEGNRMTSVGKGESLPIASNETAEGRANNRRVEIVINK